MGECEQPSGDRYAVRLALGIVAAAPSRQGKGPSGSIAIRAYVSRRTPSQRDLSGTEGETRVLTYASSPGPSGQFVSAEPDLEERRSATRAMSPGLTTNDVKSDKGDGRSGVHDGPAHHRSGSVPSGRRLLVIPQLEEAVARSGEKQPFEAAEGDLAGRIIAAVTVRARTGRPYFGTHAIILPTSGTLLL